MADNFDNYGMKVRATVDMPTVGDIDKQIRKLEKSISKLQVSGQFNDTALKNLTNQLNALKATVTTANFSHTALSELTTQVEKALGSIQISGSLLKVGQEVGSAITQGAKQNIDADIVSEMKKISDSSTSAMIQNENKKQKEISESTAQYKELFSLLSKLQDIQDRVVNSPVRSKFSKVNLWKRNEIYSADDYTESWQAAKNIKTKYGEYTKSVSQGKSIEIQQATFDQVGRLIENYFVQYGKHSADILKQSLPQKMHPLVDEISDDVASFGERLKQYRAENIKQYGESIISSAYETVKAQIASMGKDINIRTITEPGDGIFDDVTKTISASDDIKSIIPDVSYNADSATESWKNFDAILQQVCNALGVEIPKAESVLENQSTSTANTVIQNEEKKQQAIQETVRIAESLNDEDNSDRIKEIAVEKAKARNEINELRKEIEDETGVKVNVSDIKQAQKEIEQVNQVQQEGTRENIKLREQEVAHIRMLAKETKANADLEVANRQREMKLENQSASEELANRKRVAQEQKVATQEELTSREQVRKLNEQTFKEESSARKQAAAELKLQAQEQRALQTSLNEPEKRINRKIDNDVYSTDIDKLKKQFQDYGLTIEQAEAKVQKLSDTLSDMKSLSGDELIKKANEWDAELEKVKVQLDQTKLAYDQLENVNRIQHSLDVGDYDVEVSTLTSKFQKWGLSVDEVDAKMKELNTSYNNLKNANTDDKRLQAEKEYQLALEKTNNELKLMSLNSASRTDRTNLSNKIQVWLDKNTKASKEAKQRLQEYIVTLNSVDDIGVPALNNIKQKFAEIEIAERSADRLGKSFIDTMRAGAQKFVEWGLASNAVMAVWQGLQKVYDEALKLDDVMNDLAIATDITTSEMESLVNKWSDLGEDLNATTSDMIASGTEWIKQGRSIADTEKLITSAMVLDKVGKLENAQATEYLTSTMKGYKVAVEDTMDIVDKLSAVDMASATDVGGLAEAMSQVANNANLAGVSMDKLLGYIAVIGETTGEGMSSVGTGLNAIFSRMGNIKLARLKDYQNSEGVDLSNVETVLRGEGISLRESTGEFRNFGEVLDEVASNWTNYSEVSQRAIASAFAG